MAISHQYKDLALREVEYDLQEPLHSEEDSNCREKPRDYDPRPAAVIAEVPGWAAPSIAEL